MRGPGPGCVMRDLLPALALGVMGLCLLFAATLWPRAGETSALLFSAPLPPEARLERAAALGARIVRVPAEARLLFVSFEHLPSRGALSRAEVAFMVRAAGITGCDGVRI